MSENNVGLYVLNDVCCNCEQRHAVVWLAVPALPQAKYCKECLADVVDMLETNENLFKTGE